VIEADPEPPYDGAFVVVEPMLPTGYRVRLDVPPGCELSRSCESKDEAWHVASSLWRALRLPLHDLTVGNVARVDRQSSNSFD
jgi:hypothetical protein